MSLLQEVCLSKILLPSVELFVVHTDEGEAADPKYRVCDVGVRADARDFSEMALKFSSGLEAEVLNLHPSTPALPVLQRE